MGKFDGILICSDWDGTLFNGKEVPAESVNAIKYFQANGGLFTVCSGRQPYYLKRYEHFVKPNTYALCMNGAIICDLDTAEMLKEEFVTDNAYAALEAALESGAAVNFIGVAFRRDEDLTRFTKEEYYEKREQIKERPVHKLTASCPTESDALKMMDAINSLALTDHTVARSFISYIEILHNDNTKGITARYLKEITHSRVLVGVGDYENDLTLIRDADIGYAVDNATSSLKAIADRVTVSVNECAIAKIIEDLEREFAKND